MCDTVIYSRTKLFLSALSYDVHIQLLSVWLDMSSLINLDKAVLNHESRPYWMKLLHSLRGGVIDDWCHNIHSLMWLARCGIHATRVQIKHGDAYHVHDFVILSLETDDIVHLGLNNCYRLTDQCMTDILSRCRKLTSIDLGSCEKVADASVLALGRGCGQLQSINLHRCD